MEVLVRFINSNEANKYLWICSKKINASMNRIILLITVAFTICCSCSQTKHESIQNPDQFPVAIDLTKKKDSFQYFSIADTSYSKYALPGHFKKPSKWIKADEERKGMLGDWYGGTYPDSFDLQDALALIDTATDMSFGSAKSWCIKNYKQ
ncbi:MAG: hypothetical protein ABUL44_00335, partial [Flavobacterium sp.]